MNPIDIKRKENAAVIHLIITIIHLLRFKSLTVLVSLQCKCFFLKDWNIPLSKRSSFLH